MIRSEGLCEVCKSSFMVQLHHIVGGHGKRTQHETVESVVALCWYCHHGTNGWHGKNSLAIKTKLRLELQDTYKSKGYTKEEIRKLMGGQLYYADTYK